MVMKLHTGVPGAGKSYLLLKSFTETFCSWDKDDGHWEIKPQAKNIRLISNIEGLTLDHENLDVLISERCQALARRRVLEESGGVEGFEDVCNTYYLEYMQERTRWFFNDEYQQSLAVDCSLIYLIEESQRYFDTAELGRKPWVRDILYFFERHRHHGVSMFMDTQHSSKLHRGIVALFEEEIRAKPRTLSVMGEFRYDSYSDGLKTNQMPIIVKPDKRIFAAYQSMTAAEAVKPKRPIFKLICFVAVMGVLAVFITVFMKRTVFAGSESTEQRVVKSSISIPSTASTGSAPQVSVGAAGAVVEGEWKHLDHFVRENGDVWVLHPIYNTILPLKEFDIDVKAVSDQLFYNSSV